MKFRTPGYCVYLMSATYFLCIFWIFSGGGGAKNCASEPRKDYEHNVIAAKKILEVRGRGGAITTPSSPVYDAKGTVPKNNIG